MTRPRVPETNQGIQGQLTVEIYDQMQRRLRDKGWIETREITKGGITHGLALEIGPGPGYLGLEWLKNTQGTVLKGLDISADMIAVAERNAGAYGRIILYREYAEVTVDCGPFPKKRFVQKSSKGLRQGSQHGTKGNV